MKNVGKRQCPECNAKKGFKALNGEDLKKLESMEVMCEEEKCLDRYNILPYGEFMEKHPDIHFNKSV